MGDEVSHLHHLSFDKMCLHKQLVAVLTATSAIVA